MLSKQTLRRLFIGMSLLVVLLGLAGVLVYRWYRGGGESESNTIIYNWLVNPASREDSVNIALTQCHDAPFILPSSGLIGLLWADPAAPYTPIRRHTGIDIFGDGAPNTVPIYAVYDGYLTRLDDWRSTVIIRHDDPLQAGRTIWTYYTHMANRNGDISFIADTFPAGTTDVFVEQGTLLGYQGEFAGNAPPVAMHLHFSIVTSDVDGRFLNEALLGNTLDPSPYFGMNLNVDRDTIRPIPCDNS